MIQSSKQTINMTAAATLTSRHNLHTGSSVVPLSYTTAYSQEMDYSCTLLSTSTPSGTRDLHRNYETSMDSTLNSFAFVNGGYSSPIETRKRHTASVLQELDETENKENVASNLDRSSGGFICPYTSARGPYLYDNVHKLTVPLSVRPQINIRLMRAKSPSNESILNHDNNSQLEDTTEPVSESLDHNHSKNSTTPFLSHKRGWYLQKVGALFKRKSSKSMNNLTCTSTDDLSGRGSEKIQVATVGKSQSYSSIHDIVEPKLERLTKLQIKEKMKAIHAFLREGRTKVVNEFKGSEEELTRTNRSMDTEENMSSQGHVKVHNLERSYSLIRRYSELNDSSHVNFTRIPSLRSRTFHLVLHHQFTTLFTPQTDGEVHMIKDATHVQPLDNGDAVVTDILCNNMVLFGADGHPKITFSFEAGSEPYATCLTLEGCLAVTLKRQGCVALWSTSGEPVTEFGHTVLSGPAGIQCDRHGRFIVADEQANSVFVFSKDGELLTNQTPASTPEIETEANTSPLLEGQKSPFAHLYHNSFKQPRYVCLTHSGNYVIADSANHCIKIFDENMQFINQFGSYGRGDGCFKFPYGVASDADGNLYVADHFNNRVSIFSAEGEFIQHLLTIEDGIARPKSVAVCRSLLYVTHGDIRSNKVSVFTLEG